MLETIIILAKGHVRDGTGFAQQRRCRPKRPILAARAN